MFLSEKNSATLLPQYYLKAHLKKKKLKKVSIYNVKIENVKQMLRTETRKCFGSYIYEEISTWNKTAQFNHKII